MATEQTTPRGKDKWGIETYLKGSLILAVATVAFATVLYVQSMLNEVTWGTLTVVSAALTLLGFFYAERSRAVRVVIRSVVFAASAVALIGWAVCTVVTCLQPVYPMPSIGLFAALFSPLTLFLLPPLSVLSRSRKPLDIWLHRIVATLYAVMLIVSSGFGDFVNWNFSSVYVNVFACVLTALAANFAWLIPTKEKK